LDIIQEIEDGMVTANYIRSLNIDEPLARLDSLGGVRFYHTDALGSVIALTDELGEIKTQYNYTPFGTVEVIGEESDNPFQYTGRENDGTGLMYYRARYYSPEMKRFISEDPIGMLGGVNFYSYVGNGPVNFTDKMGLKRGELVFFEHFNPHYMHVGFDQGNNKVLLLTKGVIKSVDLQRYKEVNEFNIVGNADISGYISADEFEKNVFAAKDELERNFNDWNELDGSTMCIDVIKEGFGDSLTQLENDIRKAYNTDPTGFEGKLGDPFFWRRNINLINFFNRKGLM
jgi:RHS repeat-associated protein